VHFDTGIGKY